VIFSHKTPTYMARYSLKVFITRWKRFDLFSNNKGFKRISLNLYHNNLITLYEKELLHFINFYLFWIYV
jgi:hypothetical protein